MEIDAAISEFSPKMMEIFKHLRTMTAAETSQKMNIPVTTIKYYRKKIRESLEKSGLKKYL